jgi:hypothetical protein
MQSTALAPLGALTGDERCSLCEAQHLASLPAAAGRRARPARLGCVHHNQTSSRYVAGTRHRPSVFAALVPSGTNLAQRHSAVESHRL